MRKLQEAHIKETQSQEHASNQERVLAERISSKDEELARLNALLQAGYFLPTRFPSVPLVCLPAMVHVLGEHGEGVYSEG